MNRKLNICLIDCGSDKISDIAASLNKQECIYDILKLEKANDYDFNQYDGIVISGGPALFTDQEKGDFYKAQFAFLDTLGLPVFGICLGHQAIGIRHGVKAYLGKERREHDVIRIVTDHPIVNGLKSGSIFVKDHCEGIPLPDDFMLIGSSDDYEVEIMAHERKPLFGVQFHPESSGESGDVLFRNFTDIIRHKE